MTRQTQAYLFALSAILLWSTVATAFKISLNELDNNFGQLLFYASATTLIILSVVLIIQGKFRNILSFSIKEYVMSAGLGFLNPFLYYIVLLKAYSILPAQLAQPLNYTWPVMLVILSVIFLGQKAGLKSIIAIIVSFLGVLAISLQINDVNSETIQHIKGIVYSSSLTGILLATGSSIIWAMFWIFNVKDKRDEVVKLFLNFFFGLIFIIIYNLLFSEFAVPNASILLSTAYVGCFEMGFTFILWLKAMQLTTSNDKISNLVFISPFVSLIFIRFILGENIYYSTIVGLVFIVIGIVIQKVRFAKKR